MADGISIAAFGLGTPLAAEHRRLASKHVVLDTTTTRTLTAADHGRRIWFTNSSTINVTVPSGLPDWFECEMVQKGTGQIVVTAGSGAQVDAYSGWKKSLGQWARLTLANTGEDDKFGLFGDITA